MFVEIKSADIKDGIKYATLTSYNLVTYYTGTFNDYDFYLFICQIKRNARNAREQMEERALVKVLKKVVNEEFEWS